jgi:predicted O-methyltransferase YrrM
MKRYSLMQFAADVVQQANLRAVLDTHGRLTPDPLLEEWIGNLRRKCEAGTPYWDLACAVRQCAAGLEAERYLEIGVRRGKSMAMAAGTRPTAAIYGFDMWMSPYSGAENPGPSFVNGEMERVGFRGTVEWVNGDTAETLPRFVAGNPGAQFDLVTVDGDHSDEGAWRDLQLAAPMVAPGGYLVFDDLTHPGHTLYRVWQRFVWEYAGEFETIENVGDHNGTGVARRRD